MKLSKISAAILVGVACSGSPALAHHSYAMFDRSKDAVVQGTVKELQWSNPHCWLQVMVADAKTGKLVEYGFESNGPSALQRTGWSKKALVPGDKVTVHYHPLRSGDPGGDLVSAALPGGKVLSVQAPGLQAPPAAR